MDAAAEGELQVKVHAFDEVQLLKGLQKLANRVTMGLVLAGLIMGAAMLMRVQTSSQLFGYPSFAIVCFVLATIAAAALLWSIAVGDRREDRNR
jgi:hypothetical protein